MSIHIQIIGHEGDEKDRQTVAYARHLINGLVDTTISEKWLPAKPADETRHENGYLISSSTDRVRNPGVRHFLDLIKTGTTHFKMTDREGYTLVVIRSDIVEVVIHYYSRFSQLTRYYSVPRNQFAKLFDNPATFGWGPLATTRLPYALSEGNFQAEYIDFETAYKRLSWDGNYPGNAS